MPDRPDWNPENYGRHAAFVPEIGVSLVDLLAPQPGERVLDLGCGDGRLTLELQARGADVLGVDASPAQVAAAQARGVAARVVDGQNLPFAAEFDAVFSNAALHWMKANPPAVLAGVWRALRPAGRFVVEMGAAGNVGIIRDALHAAVRAAGVDPEPLDPWYFPAAEDYRALLTKQGFVCERFEAFVRPTTLSTDLDGWLATFAGPFLAPLAAADRRLVTAAIKAAVRPALLRPDGQWVADYHRLRFVARKPA